MTGTRFEDMDDDEFLGELAERDHLRISRYARVMLDED